MIIIDKKYDLVLTYSPINEVSGHLFECFDYYLFLKDNGFKPCILLFNLFEHISLKDLFEDKYNVLWKSVKDDIFRYKINAKDTNLIATYKDIPIIITDGDCRTLEEYNIFFNSQKLFGFASDLENDYLMAPKYKNIVFLQDYRIYSKSKEFRSIDYVKKLPFKFYRQYETNLPYDIGLIYINESCRKTNIKIIEKWHKMSKCRKTILLTQKKNNDFDKIDGIIQKETPLKDLFSKFSVYIYTPIKRQFDCSPRLLTECFMFNKKVIIDLPYFDIGLQTRLNDCKNNIQKLNLKQNDSIINIFKK